MRYYPLRKKEINQMKRSICSRYANLCNYVASAGSFTVARNGGLWLIIIDEIPAFITDRLFSDFIPTVLLAKKAGVNALPYVEVDEGAVKHIINGADIMVPGIKELSEFNKDDILVVLSPQKVPLAIGRALMSSSEIRKVSKGKAIKNLQHVGDKIWRLALQYLAKQGK